MAAPISAPASFRGAHVLSIRQFDAAALEHLCATADVCRALVAARGGCDVLRHRVLANTFYEPSTRTSCSFASAMARLGGAVLQVNEATSSAAKGETLRDAARALACYADVVVLRHPVVGSAAAAAAACPVPVINAGDGVGEHPTQALLDFATIRGELGGVRGLVVALVGDLKNGRTVHSLARLLAAQGVKEIVLVAPPELGMPAEICAEVSATGTALTSASLDDAVPRADVIYVTRVQKERFADAAEYERLKHAFIVTPATLARARARSIVMHPLPRVGEIDDACDADPRAAYFRQMSYGLWVRMALLALVLGVTKEQLEAARDAPA